MLRIAIQFQKYIQVVVQGFFTLRTVQEKNKLYFVPIKIYFHMSFPHL